MATLIERELREYARAHDVMLADETRVKRKKKSR
jgi:hypothetical protein